MIRARKSRRIWEKGQKEPMKILTVADEENKWLWDYFDRDRVKEIDLILSCGDLDPDYLQFLVTMVNCPLLYVRGNHDAVYDRRPPLGCVDVDGTVYNYRGLRILGLGGSMRYREGKDMYTESEMKRRIRRLQGKLTLTNGFDILLTHAPASGYGDLEDLPHRGFCCFNELIERWHPKYMLHGHVHKNYGTGFQRELTHAAGTKIVNCCDAHILEIGENEYPARGKTGSALYDLYISLTGNA